MKSTSSSLFIILCPLISSFLSMAEQGCEKEIVRVLQNLYREAKAEHKDRRKGREIRGKKRGKTGGSDLTKPFHMFVGGYIQIVGMRELRDINQWTKNK